MCLLAETISNIIWEPSAILLIIHLDIDSVSIY